MGATAGKRTVWGSVLWCAAMAVPAAAAAFLIYDKQQSIAGAAPPAASAPEVSREETAPVERVVVVPRYADPDLLERKKRQDALLRPRYESAQRQAEAREAMANAAGAMKHTGNARPSRVGPAPEPPEGVFPPNSGAAPAAGYAGASSGPRIYGLPEEPPAAPPPAPRGGRRR